MLIITEENYDEIVKNSEKPVLVDFYATWCGPCKRLKPEFEKFSEVNTSVVSATANVDDIQSLLSGLNIVSVPTIILFNNGVEVKRRGGFCSSEELESFVSDV